MARSAVVAFDVNETLTDLSALRPLLGGRASDELLAACFASTLCDRFVTGVLELDGSP